MTPLAALFHACLHPILVPIVLFLHWWVVWFTLGREFRATLGLMLAARIISLGGGYVLYSSGALGLSDNQLDGNLLGWIVAFVAAWLWFWNLEAATLGALMRRRRRSWRWKPYDLTVLGAAHVVYLAGAALLA
ncbi:MAG: hypothetical protein ACPG31_10445 [Planctomycetota bacterium]